MKLITYVYNGTEGIGVLTEDGSRVCPIKGFSSMNELIEKHDKDIMRSIEKLVENEEGAVEINRVIKKAPIPCPKQDVLCLGINYTVLS